MKGNRFLLGMLLSFFVLNIEANNSIYDFYEVVREAMPLINQERGNLGLQPLVLKDISTKRDIEKCTNHLYWTLSSPQYTSRELFMFMQQYLSDKEHNSVMICTEKGLFYLYLVRDVKDIVIDREAFEYEVLRLVNIERAKRGIAPLQMNKDLHITARIKAEEMVFYNYYSHYSPVSGSASELIESRGKRYYGTGENIAKGQTTPEQVMNSWMNSSGHKANILNPNYLYIGVGYYQDHWVQQFAGRQIN